MRKIICILVLLLLVTGCSKEITFRDTYWGMSKKDVINTEVSVITNEPKEYDEDDKSLTYQEKLDKYDVDLIYSFDNGKLVNAIYSNKSKDLDGFMKDMLQILKEKYGEPKTSRNDADVVSYGWESGKSYISLQRIKIDGSTELLSVNYSDPAWFNEMVKRANEPNDVKDKL